MSNSSKPFINPVWCWRLGVSVLIAVTAAYALRAYRRGASPEELQLALRGARGERDVKQLRALSERGDVLAPSILATRYAVGEGVTKDMHEAAAWYRKAAEMGYVPAQLMYATMCRLGDVTWLCLVAMLVCFGLTPVWRGGGRDGKGRLAKSHKGLSRRLFFSHQLGQAHTRRWLHRPADPPLPTT